MGNKVFALIKNTDGKTIGVRASINGVMNDYSIEDIISNHVLFENATMCQE